MKRKLLALLLAFAMAVSLSPSALAAKTAKAATIRLEKTEGTVTLKDENKKTLTPKDGMKLYSDYNLLTAAASYAWASLDDAKAIKLDADTDATIKSSGKKLEVRVNSGAVFFDVTVPVAADASFTVKTSTMTTGIRGTAGILSSDGGSDCLVLLHGTVEVSVTTADGESRPVTVNAGQVLVADQVPSADAPDQGVALLALTDAEVPGFVAAEIAADPVLAERVAEATDLDVAAIADAAPERLAADEAAATAEEAASAAALTQELSANESSADTSVAADTVFTAPESPSDGGSGDYVAPMITSFVAIEGTDDTTDTFTINRKVRSKDEFESDWAAAARDASQNVELEIKWKPKTGNDSSDFLWDILSKGIPSNAKVTLTGPEGAEALPIYCMTGTLMVDGSLAITNGKIKAADVTINRGGSLQLQCTFEADNISNNGTLANNGTLTVLTSITSSYKLANSGDITAIDISNAGTLTNGKTGTITATNLDNGITTVDTPGTLANNGSLTVSASFTNPGTLINSGRILGSDEDSNPGGELAFTNYATGTLENNGSGSIVVKTFRNEADEREGQKGEVTNSGAITAAGTLINNGTLTNNGTEYISSASIHVNCFENEAGGSVTNENYGVIVVSKSADDPTSGAFINSATLTNSGRILGSDEVRNPGGELTFTNSVTGTLENKEGGTIRVETFRNEADEGAGKKGEVTNSGEITVSTTFTNYGTLTNNVGNISSTDFTNSGTLTNSGTGDVSYGTIQASSSFKNEAGGSVTNGSYAQIWVDDGRCPFINYGTLINGTIALAKEIVEDGRVSAGNNYDPTSQILCSTFTNIDEATVTNFGTITHMGDTEAITTNNPESGFGNDERSR